LIIYIDNVKFIFTHHALHRMKKRKISIDDVKNTLQKRYSRRYLYADKKGEVYSFVSKEIVIIINITKNVILTVHKNCPEYSTNIRKQKRNKNKLQRKRKFGNRTKH